VKSVPPVSAREQELIEALTQITQDLEEEVAECVTLAKRRSGQWPAPPKRERRDTLP